MPREGGLPELQIVGDVAVGPRDGGLVHGGHAPQSRHGTILFADSGQDGHRVVYPAQPQRTLGSAASADQAPLWVVCMRLADQNIVRLTKLDPLGPKPQPRMFRFLQFLSTVATRLGPYAGADPECSKSASRAERLRRPPHCIVSLSKGT